MSELKSIAAAMENSTDVIVFDEGEVSIEYPRKMTVEEYGLFCEWIDLLKEKMRPQQNLKRTTADKLQPSSDKLGELRLCIGKDDAEGMK